ncbi:hypothetical protein PMZ80_001812 [Knufia obscura]|uniref:Uncharacterized protein n=2 Tax=Knufia TaxID=430999 RepID=A0AAN8E8T3_9EURO|nr:hypothetical protein PMZ80_001812 [Knufia obscura]KAK5948333.1 hypothetical protein OHC33_010643 [Knufia fluminis]
MTTYPEERVLKPLDPVPDDVNDWPDFALREVKIFYQGKGRYADLLEAAEDVPLCVLGELMPLEDEHEHFALLEDPTYVRMKIENVTNYSFGQNDDGKPVIWAAGKAGWYEVSPSDRYLSHYNDTAEAIDMFYFMVDQYQKLPQKRKRLGFQIDPFLREYQKHTDYRVDDDDEAMEILHKHHKFLLKQMIEEREDIDWSQTHLWNHLAETYSEVIEELRTNLAQQEAEGMEVEDESSEQEEEKVEASEDESSESEESQTTAQAKSAKSSQGSQTSSDSEEDTTDWTRAIWSLLNVLRKSVTFDMKTAGIEDLAREVEKMSGFSGNHKAAMTAIERAAESLLRLMNEAKLRKKFNWSTRAIYAELEATLADEIAEDVQTPVPRASKKKHRLKSVLRPSGAHKASKRTSSMAVGEVEDDEDEDMQDQTAPQPISSPVARKQGLMNGHRGASVESGGSRMDSPSRQLNGHFNADALPELPPGPETQEMLDLIRNEAKKHGRVNQVYNLEALLGRFNGEL